jgi:hypothetical protein
MGRVIPPQTENEFFGARPEAQAELAGLPLPEIRPDT